MPPKAKVKRQKKNDKVLSTDDKYHKTLREVEALKDHLALRKQIARRSVEASEEWKKRMQQAEHNLENQERTHRAVSADLSRQYRIKQAEQEQNLNKLDVQLRKSREDLELTSAELESVRTISEITIREKTADIDALNLRISSLSTQCDTLMNDQLDKLAMKVTALTSKWDEKSDNILSEVRTLLQSYGYSTIALK